MALFENKEMQIEINLFKNNKHASMQYDCDVDELDKVVSEIKAIKKEFSEKEK